MKKITLVLITSLIITAISCNKDEDGTTSDMEGIWLVTSQYSGDTTSYTKYTYDEDFILSSEYQMYPNGDTSGIYLYECNRSGKIVTYTRKRYNDSIGAWLDIEKKFFEYGDHGGVIKETIENYNSQETYIYIYTWSASLDTVRSTSPTDPEFYNITYLDENKNKSIYTYYSYLSPYPSDHCMPIFGYSHEGRPRSHNAFKIYGNLTFDVETIDNRVTKIVDNTRYTTHFNWEYFPFDGL